MAKKIPIPTKTPTDKIIVVKGSLVGRDPAKGRLAFRTGIRKTRKQRENTRGDKYHAKEKDKQTSGEI